MGDHAAGGDAAKAVAAIYHDAARHALTRRGISKVIDKTGDEVRFCQPALPDRVGVTFASPEI